MSAPARLLALRLQGFKSFAERTVVEFGPGISAVVGPNGSGKSNLADALRWSLGEQGRALRSRKSEDVIFSGSEKRKALGMADVTLVLDNADGLLPLDFAVLELGRRLYRSGENDYLLNKQRIRLRDLVDLLDGAHLADNAFLFIGQGMVDQALALRPEERRPLFEEVAGVRRHERRRRKAEEQLAESETNLARVEDILAELRPQARRLGAQAEQQTTRLSAGEELAGALLAAAHVRWHEAAGLAATAANRVERERSEADRAMADLQAAEEAAAAIGAELGARAATERERLAEHETARAAVTERRLREARVSGDLEAIARDRLRLQTEREAAEASLAVQRRGLTVPIPARDHDLDAAVADAERLLGEASQELAALRTASRARGEEAAALRRAEAARQAEAETTRRRLADAIRRLETEQATATEVTARRTELAARAAGAAAALEGAATATTRTAGARETARAASAEADARRRTAADRAGAAGAARAAQDARLEALDARIREEDERGIARAAKRRGGRRLDEELAVEPTYRAAVEAALDELARAYVVDAASAGALAAERGILVVRERAASTSPGSAADGATGSGPVTDAAGRRFLERVSAAGGSPIGLGIRRDPDGTVTRILARTVVVEDLAAALVLQPHLPTGWTIATRDGSAVVAELAVRLGRGDAPLERRAEAERLRADVARLRSDAEAAAVDGAATEIAAAAARSAYDAALAEESRTAADRRRAEEAERAAARELEAVVREAGWHTAQAERLSADVERARQALAAHVSAGLWGERDAAPRPGSADGDPSPSRDEAAIATWERRSAELRDRRDRLATQQTEADAVRREIEGRRARAEATVAMDEERIVRSERDTIALAEREEAIVTERRRLEGELAAAVEREERAAAVLGQVRAADAAARDRLAAAERGASQARERLRSADDRLRLADRADLEARLGRDALREQFLVEIAGLGELGRRRLEAEAGVVPVAVGPGPLPEAFDAAGVAMAGAPGAADRGGPTEADDTVALESALDAVAARWASQPPTTEAPSPGRLGALRRRYHELGAANPFAVEEYDALRQRLESLDTQQRDLRTAIDKTRQLIAELNTMIADQFRTTFAALETAFDDRFQQLFGGGFARLSLTDPTDLAATGVEIVARPPGKKAQALAMLSGGERALTAVALLFAMLEIRPVPFCVLDEVDAALDEANVGRFADALRSLADRTQFIVITHNRGTIEAADALYGVTVGDDSVSRVISLRLDEAKAIAERQTGRRGLDEPEGETAAGAGAGDGPGPVTAELAEVG